MENIRKLVYQALQAPVSQDVVNSPVHSGFISVLNLPSKPTISF